MNYFIDTEFIEGTQTKRFFGFPIPTFRWNRNDKLEIGWLQSKPTIDLISIAIVAEDGRELYCISKEFNLQEAWERFQLDYGNGDERNKPPKKVYWIRDNVLKPVYKELLRRDLQSQSFDDTVDDTVDLPFTYKNLKVLLDMWGDTNKSIADQVGEFVNPDMRMDISPVFYGYFADYDWVVFCWLFGKMKDLPKGFPYYCMDLKQMLDENLNLMLHFLNIIWHEGSVSAMRTQGDKLKLLKKHESYPKQENDHDALDDARWNKKLYDFLRQPYYTKK